MKTLFSRQYDSDNILGKSEFTETQVEAMNSTRVKLSEKYIYVALPQYVHDENAGSGVARRIFLFECTKKEIHSILTFNRSSLLGRYIQEGGSELRIGVRRSITKDIPVWVMTDEDAQETISVWTNLNGAPFRGEGKNAFVSRPFAFTVKRRKFKCWVMQLIPTMSKDIYDRKVKDDPEKGKILDLSLKALYEYTEVDIPDIDFPIEELGEYKL